MKVKLKAATQGGYNCAIKITDIKITDLEAENVWDKDTETPSEYNQVLEPKDYAEGGSYALPSFYAPSFLEKYSEKNVSAKYFTRLPKVNVFDEDEKKYKYLVSSTCDGLKTARNNIFCPMPYLAYIIDKIIDKTKYKIQKSIFREVPELQQLVLYNNAIVNSLKTSNQNIRNRNFFSPTERWDLRNHVSKMKIPEFLKILNLFCCRLFTNAETNTASIRSLRDILHALPGFEARFPLKDFISEPSFDNVEFSFDCGESLAGGMGIDISEQNIIYLGEQDTLPENAEYTSVVRLKGPHMSQYYLRVDGTDEDENWVEGWQLAGMAQKPFNKNEKAKNVFSVESPIGPVFSALPNILKQKDAIYIDDNHFRNNDTGIFSQTLAREYMDDNLKDRGIYITMVEDSAIVPNTYEAMSEEPNMGLGFARKAAGSDKPAPYTVLRHEQGECLRPCDIALRWEGANGLYETFWRPVAEWLTAPTTRKCKFTIPAMSVTDYEKMKRADKVRINEQNYIIDTLKADFGDTVTNIQVEAYTCF